MSLSLRSGMTFLSQVGAVGVKDELTSTVEVARRKEFGGDWQPWLCQVPGDRRDQARDICVWSKGQRWCLHLSFMLLFFLETEPQSAWSLKRDGREGAV